MKCAERKKKCAAGVRHAQGGSSANVVHAADADTSRVCGLACRLQGSLEEFKCMTQEAGATVVTHEGKPWRMNAKIQKKLRKLRSEVRQLTKPH